MKQESEDKWKFCPDMICQFCKKELNSVDEVKNTNEIITYCYFCKRSFLE